MYGPATEENMGGYSTDNPALAVGVVTDSQVEREDRLAGPVIQAGRLALDTGRMEANAGHGPVRLTRQEFLLLKEFVSHPGRTVPRAVLLAVVWGLDFDPGSNVVDVCVRRLRSKLGFDLIRTVRGKGYQLLAELPRQAPRLRDVVG
jgi:DNA-binding response OmpR family regulator